MKKMLGWTLAVLLVSFILLNIVNLFYYSAEVPTSSMSPTIPKNSRLVIKNISKGEYSRGDILVFRSSEENGKLLVKRLIGISGDRVSIKDGNVFVNGSRLKEPYIKYNDKFNGNYVVPKGKLFFLGDYRKISNDSRYWQCPFVKDKDVIGKVVVRLFPDFKIF